MKKELTPIPTKDNERLAKLFKLSIKTHSKYRRAIAEFEKARKKHGLNNELLCYLGSLYEHAVYGPQGGRTGRKILPSRLLPQKEQVLVKKSLSLFKEVLKNDPEYIRAIRGIAKLYKSMKSFEGALFYYKKALKLSGGEGAPEIGLVYQMMGKNEKALKWYEKYLKDNPKDATAAINYLGLSNGLHRNKMRPYAIFLKNNFQKIFGHLQPDRFKKALRLTKFEVEWILDSPFKSK